MPQLLMTPVITAAMSKLIKVVGSLSHFHVEARVAQRRFPVIAVGGTSIRLSAFNLLTCFEGQSDPGTPRTSPETIAC